MNEDEFFRILGIDVKESDETSSFFYEEYFYDDNSDAEIASESYDP
jgi:hypothetical protein|tara:strand:- start:181 stop:318 length:138 start_codon:yes stop_codon:yes gene_type:complete